MKRTLLLLFALALAITSLDVSPADAQIWKKIKDTAKAATEREVLNEVDRKVTETVRCTIGDQSCIDQAESEGKTVETVDANGNPVSATASGNAGATATANSKPGEGAWLNYDFVPGDIPIFVEDLSGDNVGDFPRRLEFKEGNMEIAEWQGRRLLRGTSWPSVFYIPLPETLPERFTVELDVVPGAPGRSVEVHFAEAAPNHVQARYFQDQVEAGVVGEEIQAVSRTKEQVGEGVPFPLRIMVDGSYVKVYAGATRVANVPNADFGRSNKIRIELPGDDISPAFIGNIRVMAGGKKLYDVLAAEGRVATHGILFDTGSDRIRPESTPTLKEIGEMLQQHADLNLTIEGHTDNVGEDAANQSLSEKRAAAVKAYLVGTYGIEAGRLEAQGFGETKPATNNDTPEGRQQNRRVELVRS